MIFVAYPTLLTLRLWCSDAASEAWLKQLERLHGADLRCSRIGISAAPHMLWPVLPGLRHPNVTEGRHKSHEVTWGHMRSHEVTWSHMWLTWTKRILYDTIHYTHICRYYPLHQTAPNYRIETYNVNCFKRTYPCTCLWYAYSRVRMWPFRPLRDPMAVPFYAEPSGWFDRWSFGNLWSNNHPPHIGRVHPDWALQSNEIGHTRPWSCCLKHSSTKLFIGMTSTSRRPFLNVIVFLHDLHV